MFTNFITLVTIVARVMIIIGSYGDYSEKTLLYFLDLIEITPRGYSRCFAFDIHRCHKQPQRLSEIF